MLKVILTICALFVVIGWIAVLQSNLGGGGGGQGSRAGRSRSNYGGGYGCAFEDEILSDDVYGDDHNLAGDVDEGESP